jgi:hypothetical protein
MKILWIIFLSANVFALVIAYLFINGMINEKTVAIIVFGLLCTFGIVFLICQIIKTIKFSKALKSYRKELPELIKEGLVDPEKIINAKFPDV